MVPRLTDDEVNKILLNHGLIKIDKTEYKNNTTKILCLNTDGYKVMPTIQHLKSNKMPRPFDKNNPYTIENIRLFLSRYSPNIELLSNEYISSDAKLHCKCKIDDCEWYVCWENLKQKQGCPQCRYEKIRECNLNTLDEIKTRLKAVRPDLTILDKEYIDSTTKLTIRCSQGHIFKRSWCLLLQNSNCPECAKINYPGSYNLMNAKLNKEEWLKRDAIVYIVKLFDGKESFYKIGITNRSVEARIKNNIPYL